MIIFAFMKLQFTGHESFICKHFWLKKGYDFVAHKGNFNDESAVVELGVGKNMVGSISYWLKAFGITDQGNKLTQFGHYIFHDKDGKDPYIESIGTLWLLQYQLIKSAKASLYPIFFNEFKREKSEFTKEQLTKFIIKKTEQEGKVNENTINADVSVFIRNYLISENKGSKTDIEEDFSSLLTDLELMTNYQVINAEDKAIDWYRVENRSRPDLPEAIFLYTILDNPTYSKSIPFKELLTGYNSPGAVFSLSDDGLYEKIEQITKSHRSIIYTETAGVRELQIKTKLNKDDILDGYYD